ncbi:MAG: MFS transporter [Alphaproteobacteria bacterium]|nr:MFS transporter [Alphaproteobacteria bacterium]
MKKKVLAAAMIGNALEYYDFTLYGFFAAYLSPLYFPSDDPLTSMIASFGAFAAGFLMRPLGGLIFGHVGDRYGRRLALLISVLLVTFPTLIIGILPTYSQIGILAPIAIVLCRIIQGICTAGEYTGATVLIAEYTEHNRPGFACSILPASSLIGAILGTILGAICLMDIMPSWAWRLPFIMGFVFGLFGLYIRKEIKESPAFSNLSKNHAVPKSPVLEIFKYQKRNLLCTIGIGAAALAPFYIISVYINSLIAQLSTSASYAMFLNVGVLLMWMFFLPIIGYFSDKVGLKKMMSYGAILLSVVSLPVFSYVNYDISIGKILLAQITLSLCGAFFVAPLGAFLATKIFPTSYRYSGIALGISCGEAVFGGTAPLIATALVALTGAFIAPGFYLMFCGLIGLLSLHYYKPIAGQHEEDRTWKVMEHIECA